MKNQCGFDSVGSLRRVRGLDSIQDKAGEKTKTHTMSVGDLENMRSIVWLLRSRLRFMVMSRVSLHSWHGLCMVMDQV